MDVLVCIHGVAGLVGVDSKSRITSISSVINQTKILSSCSINMLRSSTSYSSFQRDL